MARMGLLLIIVAGILAIILIARWASKTVSPYKETPSPAASDLKSKKVERVLQRGLISLLLKKKIIREDELLEEIERIKKEEEMS